MKELDKNIDDMLVTCPFCGCDSWFISSNWFKCFLCKTEFYAKHLLKFRNVKVINENLRFIKKLGLYRQPGENEYE